MATSSPGRAGPLRFSALAAVGLVWGSVLARAHAESSIQLEDATKRTGIRFVHTDGSTGDRYIVESMSSGVAVFDYDGDGDVDIYFTNGATLRSGKMHRAAKNALYRNDGGFRFTDVTDHAGVGDTGFGLGVCIGDYDNDGHRDIYVSNHGPNVLYRNNGDGTFADVTRAAGVANGNKVGAGVNFLDADGDGDLDLFVANYVDFCFRVHTTRWMSGHEVYAGPLDYGPMPNVLYRNNGDGTFTDVSADAGLAASKGKGMGTACLDYDNDGDTDILVANDECANFLFQNDGQGKFREVGLETGIALNFDGEAQGSMGVACGDYDNDGRIDVQITSYQQEHAVLYRNTPEGLFEDVSRLTGAASGTLPHVTWGNGLVDFDNDGDKDLFIACGHIFDNVEEFDDIASYHAPNLLLMNVGGGRFVNVSDRCGDGLKVRRASRGAAFDDLDGDGDIDVVILNSRREPTVLRNDAASGNHWIVIRLRGVKTNRDGVGAHVKIVAGDLTQMDEVHSGHGYQSHFGLRLHFGLGKRDRVDRIEVRWIGGGVDVVRGVAADQFVTITEGRGLTAALPPSAKPTRDPR